jgi:prevent-host-death family protein
MTRKYRTPKSTAMKAREPARAGYWLLQDAKARFSELVRRVVNEGPQHVTVHGREAVVVIAAEDFRRLTEEGTGQALVDAMRACPHPEFEVAPTRAPMPVRGVDL